MPPIQKSTPDTIDAGALRQETDGRTTHPHCAATAQSVAGSATALRTCTPGDRRVSVSDAVLLNGLARPALPRNRKPAPSVWV